MKADLANSAAVGIKMFIAGIVGMIPGMILESLLGIHGVAIQALKLLIAVLVGGYFAITFYNWR